MIETVREGLTVVGTAHVSAQSVRDVEDTIRAQRPQRVLVELDAGRLAALRDPEAWKRTDLFRIIKDRKQHLFLLQLYLASMQARMGEEQGVAPGTELLKAVETAEEVGADVVLIDRDIAVTLRRGFAAMGLRAKLRLLWNVWVELLTPADPEKAPAVDELLKTDAVTRMTEEFARIAPEIKTALIDERDVVMASRIRDEAGKGSVVAVVGAGHMPGIGRHLAAPSMPPAEPLLAAPPRRFSWALALSFVVPLLLASLVGWYVLAGKQQEIVAAGALWASLHVLLAGIGASLALGHPLAVLTGALTAPFTSVLPTGLKSGWLAGLVQANRQKPTVADFEAVKKIRNVRDFWTNGVVRVVTVTGLTNLGSMVASWIVVYHLLRGLG